MFKDHRRIRILNFKIKKLSGCLKCHFFPRLDLWKNIFRTVYLTSILPGLPARRLGRLSNGRFFLKIILQKQLENGSENYLVTFSVKNICLRRRIFPSDRGHFSGSFSPWNLKKTYFLGLLDNGCLKGYFSKTGSGLIFKG